MKSLRVRNKMQGCSGAPNAIYIILVFAVYLTASSAFAVDAGITGRESSTVSNDIWNQSQTSANTSSRAAGGYSQAAGLFSALCSMCKKVCPWCPMATKSNAMSMQMINSTFEAMNTRLEAERQKTGTTSELQQYQLGKQINFTPNIFNVDGDPATVETIPAAHLAALNKMNPQLAKNIQEFMRNMDKSGIKVQNGQITYPDSIEAADDERSGDKANAIGELTPEQLAQKKKIMAKVSKTMGLAEIKALELNTSKINKSASESTESEATPEAPSVVSDPNDKDWWKKLAQASQGGGLREPTSGPLNPGKTRMFGGEPVGVSSDDIFQMIRVRYDIKREQSYFLPP